MELVRSNLNDYLLSPIERKQKQELLAAIQILDAAVKEFQAGTDSHPPNLRSRELMQGSSKAVSTLKAFVEGKF